MSNQWDIAASSFISTQPWTAMFLIETGIIIVGNEQEARSFSWAVRGVSKEWAGEFSPGKQ